MMRQNRNDPLGNDTPEPEGLGDEIPAGANQRSPTEPIYKLSRVERLRDAALPVLRRHGLCALLVAAAPVTLRVLLYRAISDPLCCAPALSELPLVSFYQLLLPFAYDNQVVHWAPSSLPLIEFARRTIGLNATYLLLIASASVVAYYCGLQLFRYRLPSMSLGLMVGCGTHLNYMYYHNHIGAYYLFVIYIMLNLVFAYRIAFTDETRRKNVIGFVLTLVLALLFVEVSLNYVLFLLLAGTAIWIFARKTGDSHQASRVASALAGIVIIVALYVAARATFTSHVMKAGSEEEIVFTYTTWSLMIEDLVGNLFLYLYAALTIFLPPQFLFSNSLIELGNAGVIAEQHGYHKNMEHLASMNHIYLWRFYAGAVCAGFFAIFLGTCRRLIWFRRHFDLIVFLLLLLILLGFASHEIIKFRPYSSVPFLTYKCITSIIGVYVVTAAAIAYIEKKRPRMAILASIALWMLLLWNSVTRPYFEHTAYQAVGLIGEGKPYVRLSH
jgi:hypothetical protein